MKRRNNKRWRRLEISSRLKKSRLILRKLSSRTNWVQSMVISNHRIRSSNRLLRWTLNLFTTRPISSRQYSNKARKSRVSLTKLHPWTRSQVILWRRRSRTWRAKSLIWNFYSRLLRDITKMSWSITKFSKFHSSLCKISWTLHLLKRPKLRSSSRKLRLQKNKISKNCTQTRSFLTIKTANWEEGSTTSKLWLRLRRLRFML
jgi:hypothetical protein